MEGNSWFRLHDQDGRLPIYGKSRKNLLLPYYFADYLKTLYVGSFFFSFSFFFLGGGGVEWGGTSSTKSV